MDVPPLLIVYVPIGQRQQMLEPGDVPFGQLGPGKHGIKPSEYVPATQSRQAVEPSSEPFSENLPAAQAEHSDKADLCPIVPALHNVHVEAPAPAYEPAGQLLQPGERLVLEYVPGRQGWQVSILVAPVAAENVPAAHSPEHVVAPDVPEYVPLSHGMHVVA